MTSAIALLVLAPLLAQESLPATASDRSAPPIIGAARLPKLETEGQVFVRGSRRPVAGAAVMVDGDVQAVTDRTGHFKLELLAGAHRIEVDEAGFEPFSMTYQPGAPGQKLIVRLPPRAGARFETVVRANEMGDPPKTSLAGDELTATPGAAGDALRAVATLPGVTQPVSLLPLYVVRGSNPGTTNVWLDDMRLPQLYHFGLGPSVVNSALLGGLDFYPGGQPERYQSSVGGAIVATTAAPPTDAVHAIADVRLYDAGGLVSMPLSQGKGSLLVAGRYSYTGSLLSWLGSGFHIAYWDYQVRAEHALGSGRLVLLALGSGDKYGESATDDGLSRSDTELFFHRVLLKYNTPLGSNGPHLSVSSGAGLDASQAPIFGVGETRSASKQVTARVELSWPVGQAWRPTMGSDGEVRWYEGASLGVAGLGGGLLAEDRRWSTLSAYVASPLSIGWLTLNPGYRIERHQLHVNETDVTTTRTAGMFRLHAAARVSKAVRLEASTGQYVSPPTLPISTPGYEGFGLATLGLQSGWQSSLGVHVGDRKSGEASVTAFANRLELTDLRQASLEDSADPATLTRRRAGSFGVETLARGRLSEKLSGYVSYTLSRSVRLLENGAETDSAWDQRHVMNIVGTYVLSSAWKVSARLAGGSGRPLPIERPSVLDITTRKRGPLWHQIDVRVERKWTLDAATLTLYLEFLNASLQSVAFGYEETPQGLRLDDEMIALPSLGLRCEL